MPDILTIPKTTSFPEYLDFFKLRETGIKHIEALGSKLWTDFNLHDPGITLLEVVTYALTDLGYRTNFDIADLLARPLTEKDKPDDNFFTAAQILTCNPVTLDDFRRLLIDIPGVKNAWFEPAEEGEIPIYLNARDKKLQYQPVVGAGDETKVKIKGLYNICVELEPRFRVDACGNPVFEEDNILAEIHETLHRHRNLCEDFREVVVFGKEDIALCGEIEIAPEADPENVMLEIYKVVEEFLSPTLHFYTLQEMLDKGRRIEEIYAGRPLTSRSHGFIDPEELKKLDLRSELYTSDLINLIMDVPGVLAARKLLIVNYINEAQLTKGEKWCVKLTPKYRPHFSLEKSRITLFKGLLPSGFDKDEIQQRYLEEKIASTKAIVDARLLDNPVPQGEYLDLDDYQSIMEDLPVTYGVGRDGIRGPADVLRQAQANQLKAYLLFFDQILANYLSQLAHVRDLFSFTEDGQRPKNLNRTYFTQPLDMAPGVEKLLKNFNECPANDGDPLPPEDYPSYLDYIAESEETYLDRRNRFLDHQLARFAESFSDYVLLMFRFEGENKKERNRRIIQDKADFLKNYPALSRDRGKGFNYKQKPVWDTDNVSGLEKRVAKLIGIDDIRQRTLGHTCVVERREGWRWESEMLNNGAQLVHLRSTKVFSTEAEAQTAWEALLPSLKNAASYRKLSYELGENKWYGFEIPASGCSLVAENLVQYDSAEARDIALETLRSSLLYPGLTVEVKQETECWFYELWSFDGSKLLLEAVHGQHTKEEAEAAFANMLALGVVADNYDWPDTGETFYLKNGTAKEAIHPHTYGSEVERKAAIQALIYYLDDSQPGPHIIEDVAASFGFEIVDNEGNVIFQSIHTYDAMSKALAAGRKARRFAKDADYYHLLEDPDSDKPHSFELLDRSEQPFASHPNWYATMCEMELVIETIIHCMGPEDYTHRLVTGEEGAWSFEVKGAGEKVLLKSTGSFGSMDALEAAWHLFAERAREEANYRKFELSDEDCPFGFELLDAAGNVIASHPHMYEIASERDQALLQVINCLCPSEMEVKPTGEPGVYYFSLQTPDDPPFFENTGGIEVLLTSEAAYPDAETTEQAWKEFLILAADIQNYHLTAGFGFTLKNAEGQEIAKHGKTDYETEADASAVAAMVVAFVRQDVPYQKIINKGGAFIALLVDENGETWLEGAHIFPNKEAAETDENAGWPAIRHFSTCPDNYQKTADGHPNCPYSFSLMNDAGDLLATHPHHYRTEAERDEAMLWLLSYMTDGELMAEKVVKEKLGYCFKLLDGDGTPLLVSAQIYETADGANQAFTAGLTLLANASNYKAIDTPGFGFEVKDAQGEVFARHDSVFATAVERDEAIWLIMLLVALHGIPWRIDETTEGFHFIFLDENGNDFLTGSKNFVTKKAAGEALIAAVLRAVVSQNYNPTQGGESCDYGFDLTNELGEIIASHPPTFDTCGERDAALAHFIEFLSAQTLLPQIEGKLLGWVIELMDFSGNVLLLGEGLWPSPEAALAYWLDYFAPDKLDQLVFEKIYDNAACKYDFVVVKKTEATGPKSCPPEILSEQAQENLAVYPGDFPTRSALDAMVEKILFLLARQDAPCTIRGTECGFYFLLTCPGEAAFSIKVSQRYPDATAAWVGGNALAELMAGEGNWRTVETADGFYLHLVNQAEETLARSLEPFLDADKAAEALAKLLAAFANPPQVSATFPFQPRAFFCEVKQEGATLLEGSAGQPFEVFAGLVEPFDSVKIRNEKMAALPDFFKNQPDDVVKNFPQENSKFRYEVTVGGVTLRSVRTFLEKESADPANKETASAQCSLFLDKAKIAANYQKLDDWQACRFGFELLDATEKQKAFEAAWEDCDLLNELGQEAANFTLVTDEAACEFGFALHRLDSVEHVVTIGTTEIIETTTQPFTLATHPCFYPSKNERLAQIGALSERLGEEGMHLVEHLLLRPRRLAAAPAWFFEVGNPADPSGLTWYLRSSQNFPTSAEAEELLMAVSSEICKNGADAFESTGTCYSYEIIGFEHTTTAACFATEALRDSAITDLIALICPPDGTLDLNSFITQSEVFVFRFAISRQLPDEKILLSSTFDYANRMEAVQALQAIVDKICVEGEAAFGLKAHCSSFGIKGFAGKVDVPGFPTPEERDAAIAWLLGLPCPWVVKDFIKEAPRSEKDLAQDQLLPVVHCGGGDDPLCTACADPYTFRATVVLPYWPKRFNNMPFRDFIETTLRREAPAHIFLRICWINACQMKEFETALRNWLEVKAEGEDSCRATPALNALTDILFKLENIYPQGTLHDCDIPAPKGSNSIILNYSILGTANTSGNGTQ